MADIQRELEMKLKKAYIVTENLRVQNNKLLQQLQSTQTREAPLVKRITYLKSELEEANTLIKKFTEQGQLWSQALASIIVSQGGLVQVPDGVVQNIDFLNNQVLMVHNDFAGCLDITFEKFKDTPVKNNECNEAFIKNVDEAGKLIKKGMKNVKGIKTNRFQTEEPNESGSPKSE